MSGNVLEWCHDWFGSYTEEPKTNPISTSPKTKVCDGSWDSSYAVLRGAATRASAAASLGCVLPGPEVDLNSISGRMNLTLCF